MSVLNSIAKATHMFCIEWNEADCISVKSASSNIGNFLPIEKLKSGNFYEFIAESVDSDRRKSKLPLTNKNSVYLDSYRIFDANSESLYVSEQIINEENDCYISIFTNVTQLAYRTNASTETSERLELVLSGTRLGMWDWNPQTNDVVFDERWAEMLGVKLSDLTQTLADWQDRVHPEDIDGCFADITAHIEGKTDAYENTHRMMHADGTWRYILDRGKVVKRDKSGNPIRFTGTHTDVTALKLAEEAAKSALSARNKFFARMSHEIRTPLHGILGTADILATKNLSNDDKHLVSIINESGEILQALLNDVLDVAKIEDDELELAVREVDALPVLKTVFKLFGQKAQSKGLNYLFQNKTGKQSICIISDATRINQIISNTISNAIKFTDSGFVALSIDIIENDLIVEVSDSGIGIKDTDAIFDAYKQEGNQASMQMGTGLGLSIVKSLTERLGIDLKLESEPEKGTSFKFNLGPAISTRIRREDTVSQLVSAQVSKKHTKALVVDDNEINLFIAKTMLEDFFKTVHIALSGKQALELVQENQNYDIVFMDLNMPGMDGIETSRKIQGLKLSHTPEIVAQTADATEEARSQLENSSVKYIITKPFTKEKVSELLSKID